MFLAMSEEQLSALLVSLGYQGEVAPAKLAWAIRIKVSGAEWRKQNKKLIEAPNDRTPSRWCSFYATVPWVQRMSWRKANSRLSRNSTDGVGVVCLFCLFWRFVLNGECAGKVIRNVAELSKANRKKEKKREGSEEAGGAAHEMNEVLEEEVAKLKERNATAEARLAMLKAQRAMLMEELSRVKEATAGRRQAVGRVWVIRCDGTFCSQILSLSRQTRAQSS